MLEYEIAHAIDRVSRQQNLTQRQLVGMILEAGRDPVERDPLYNIIEREDSRTLLPERARVALPMASWDKPVSALTGKRCRVTIR